MYAKTKVSSRKSTTGQNASSRSRVRYAPAYRCSGSSVRLIVTEKDAATTARMPEAPASSAVRYAVNGSSSTSAVSRVELPSRLRIHSVITPNSSPITTPPIAV